MYAIAITLFITLLILGCGCMALSCWAIGTALVDIINDIIRNTK